MPWMLQGEENSTEQWDGLWPLCSLEFSRLWVTKNVPQPLKAAPEIFC